MMMSRMSTPTRPERVLAADPGYGRLGVAVLAREGGRERVLFSSCIETDKDLSLPERLSILSHEVAALIEAHAPDALAVEKLFFNQNVSTALGVAEVRGMLATLAAQHQVPVFEYSPQEVKLAVTGYGKSDKHAVMSMIPRLVSLESRKRLDDELDAIAVGIACLASTRRL